MLTIGKESNTTYDRLRELNLELPSPPVPAGAYVPAKVSRGLIFASGKTPTVDRELVYRSKVGSEVTLEDAYDAVRLAALNCLTEFHHVLGDLDRGQEIVRVTGYVASAPGFGQQPQVVHGASELLNELWGERGGRHARAAIGVSELPFGAPVEIELIAEIV